MAKHKTVVRRINTKGRRYYTKLFKGALWTVGLVRLTADVENRRQWIWICVGTGSMSDEQIQNQLIEQIKSRDKLI